MDNDTIKGTEETASIIKNINHIKSGNSEKEKLVSVKYNKFMIIGIKDKKYALFADEVKEIIGNTPIFYVPFTPPYISGFINRHGEPYTVIDITVLLERENLNSTTFLILSKEDDQLALLISDVVEIVNLPENELYRMTSTVAEEDYFIGSINPSGKEEIFVFDLNTLIKKMEGDISAY
ncbi:MAG: chemotaxis protein CheW [Spirochaetales bacterium]|nr:chemotaxis protein CheW [Spirochaetales bacterium]